MNNHDNDKLSDLLGFEFRWPTRGDRLFMRADHWVDDAEIRVEASARSAFMTSGYKTAADRLVEDALADRFDRHELIYPILFCYRQFIELSLKGQILDYGGRVGVNLPGPKKDHDLKALLRNFRRMCTQYNPSDTETMVAVSKCILEFDRMDSSSFTFRYATKKNGDPYPVSIDRIDLNRLKDVMDGIGGFFVGSEGYLSDLIANSEAGYEGP